MQLSIIVQSIAIRLYYFYIINILSMEIIWVNYGLVFKGSAFECAIEPNSITGLSSIILKLPQYYYASFISLLFIY